MCVCVYARCVFACTRVRTYTSACVCTRDRACMSVCVRACVHECVCGYACEYVLTFWSSRSDLF